jgi:hypothetical protein
MPARCRNCSDDSLGLGVPRVMNFHTLRQEPFPTALTTTCEDGAAAFGAHARTKSVLTFPGALGAL